MPIAILLAGLLPPAHAGVLLDTGLGDNTTYRYSGEDGPGQGFSVGVNTELTGFGFYFDIPNGGDVEYMLWDGSNSTLLYSETDSYVASLTQSLRTTTGPLSYDLQAGQTYYVGLIADNTEIDVSFFYPQLSLTQSGLTLLQTGNSNYYNYASPTFDSTAGATIAVELSNGGGTPEPPTWLTLAGGLAAAGLVLRRRGLSPLKA